MADDPRQEALRALDLALQRHPTWEVEKALMQGTRVLLERDQEVTALRAEVARLTEELRKARAAGMPTWPPTR
jgi:hypothetical protein